LSELDPKLLTIEGCNILIVDDVKDNRVFISRMLEGAGAKTQLAANGAEALDLTNKNNFDIILMDIQMPEMDGYQVTAELRKNGYQRPILAVSAYAMPMDKTKSLEAGCNDHLTKPINRNTLLEAVR
jgi:CheY-like chemotaxis protein